MVKKVHSRLCCSRKLKFFDVREDTLQMIYATTISSIFSFEMTCYDGNAFKQDKTRVDKNTKKADGLVGKRGKSRDTAYHRFVTNKLRTILPDETEAPTQS